MPQARGCHGARDAYFKNEHRNDQHEWSIPNEDVRSCSGNTNLGGFGGAVQVLTNEHGPVALASLAGQRATFLTRDGWSTGSVFALGHRSVEEVSFVPAITNPRAKGYRKVHSNVSHKLVVTKGQTWPEGAVPYNLGLSTGAVVPSSCNIAAPGDAEYEKGFIHGLVFADGTFSHRCRDGGEKVFKIQLCGAKSRYSRLFDRVTFPRSAGGDPIVRCCSELDLKDFPPSAASPNYVAGFLDGWIAGDGGPTGNGRFKLTSQHPGALAWLQSFAALGGWIMTGFTSDSAMVTNFGPRKHRCWKYTLTRSLSVHWMARAVAPTGGPEPAFAVAIEGKKDIVLAGGICAVSVEASSGSDKGYGE